MKALSKILSTFFGAGYFPFFPGTFSSSIVVIAYYLFLHQLHWIIYLSLLLILFFSGVVFTSLAKKEMGEDDPSKIVIDEVIGQLAALFLIPLSWLNLLLAFFIFRAIDIIKPYPLKKSENLPGGWGIMSDDLFAGVLTNIIIQFILIIKK
ncbi:MAG: phosphatidylglycerophosphatase A [Candidatus Aminicenantia bacterium]